MISVREPDRERLCAACGDAPATLEIVAGDTAHRVVLALCDGCAADIRQNLPA